MDQANISAFHRPCFAAPCLYARTRTQNDVICLTHTYTQLTSIGGKIPLDVWLNLLKPVLYVEFLLRRMQLRQ
jgi:hypothetical protein